MKLNIFDRAQSICREQRGPVAAMEFWARRDRIYTEQHEYARAADAFELAADYSAMCAKAGR